MTTADTTIDTLERIASLKATIQASEAEIDRLGRELPPLTRREVQVRGNRDHTLRAAAQKFMGDFFAPQDVTLLDTEDYCKWDRLIPQGGGRYRAVRWEGGPRYNTRPTEGGIAVFDTILQRVAEVFPFDEYADDNNDENGEEAATEAAEDWITDQPDEWWVVVDSENPTERPEDDDVYDDEDKAEADATQGSEEDANDGNGLHGFPFAWNRGWVLQRSLTPSWLARLVEAGFLVYRYDDDDVIAGIDGGGYDFIEAHYVPLYAAWAAETGNLIQTEQGPRRVAGPEEGDR